MSVGNSVQTSHARIIRSAIMARCQPQLIAECGHEVMDVERLWSFIDAQVRLWDSDLFRRAYLRTPKFTRTFRFTLSGQLSTDRGCWPRTFSA